MEAAGIAGQLRAPFKYQGRCLDQLRRGYAGLSDEARLQIAPLLEAHGCLEPLQV